MSPSNSAADGSRIFTMHNEPPEHDGTRQITGFDYKHKGSQHGVAFLHARETDVTPQLVDAIESAITNIGGARRS
jgi:hypothetical protein